jgi:hypothetical protein
VGINYILYGDVTTILFFNNHYRFVGGFFENPVRDTVTVLIILLLVRGAIVATVCFYRLHGVILALVPIVIWIGDFILIRLHILTFKYIWCMWLFAAGDIVVLLCCYYFNQVLSNGRNKAYS